jgi:hypothetical protein
MFAMWIASTNAGLGFVSYFALVASVGLISFVAAGWALFIVCVGVGWGLFRFAQPTRSLTGSVPFDAH